MLNQEVVDSASNLVKFHWMEFTLCDERFLLAPGEGYSTFIGVATATSSRLQARLVMRCTKCFEAGV